MFISFSTLQYVSYHLLHHRFWRRLAELCKNPILPGRHLWGMQWGLCAPHEVLGVFPHSGYMEEPQDNITIRVMPCVIYEYVPKETLIHTKKIVLLGTHLPPQTHYYAISAVLCPLLVAREKVHQHVFKSSHRQLRRDLIVPSSSLGFGQL